MSFYEYLNKDEEIKYRLEIQDKNPNKIKEIVAVTTKRVFHLQQLKGYNRIYRDIPLSKVKYLENVWHGYNIKLLVISIILFIIGIAFIMNLYLWFISIGFFIPAIILLVKALKNYGYFLINNNDWKFTFRRRADVKVIEEIIQNIYFLQAD